MVPYKIVRADSGDAWVEVSMAGCGPVGYAVCKEGENVISAVSVDHNGGGGCAHRNRCHGGKGETGLVGDDAGCTGYCWLLNMQGFPAASLH